MCILKYSDFNIFPGFCDVLGIYTPHVRPNFDPRFALSEPTRSLTHVFIFNAFQQQDMRLLVYPNGWQEPYGKDDFMTFDLEQYRKHLAPLKLPKEQENAILDELWPLAEHLARASREAASNPLYPLQFALVAETFDAVERAIALESKENTKAREEEETCP